MLYRRALKQLYLTDLMVGRTSGRGLSCSAGRAATPKGTIAHSIVVDDVSVLWIHAKTFSRSDVSRLPLVLNARKSALLSANDPQRVAPSAEGRSRRRPQSSAEIYNPSKPLHGISKQPAIAHAVVSVQ